MMAMAMHTESPNWTTGSMWTRRRTHTVVKLVGRCCGPYRRCAVTLQAVGASQYANEYSATMHTQAGQEEGGTTERGDPRCDPSETGGCRWHSC